MCKASVEQRAQVKNKRKITPGSVKAPKPKKKKRARGRAAGGEEEEGQWSCFGACARVLQQLHTKAKRLLQEEAEELLARTLARSFLCCCCCGCSSFAVVVCYCCLHPGSSTLPSRSTTFVYKTVEPSMSSFKLLWWSPDQCYSRRRTD